MDEKDQRKPSLTDWPMTSTDIDGIDLDERKCAVMQIDLPWEPATLHAKRREKLSADIDLSVQGAAVRSKKKRRSPSRRRDD